MLITFLYADLLVALQDFHLVLGCFPLLFAIVGKLREKLVVYRSHPFGMSCGGARASTNILKGVYPSLLSHHLSAES